MISAPRGGGQTEVTIVQVPFAMFPGLCGSIRNAAGLPPEIYLKINGLLVGTPDTRAESMLCERFGSAGRSAGLGDCEFSGREGVENPIIRGRHYGGSNHLG